MRFLANGPLIPDELLLARDEGRVVFFCGAGVSRARAGLTDFLGLAHAVADKLAIASESPTRRLIKAIETFTPIPGVGSLISADRVFGLIEREFRTHDIYSAIAASLRPEPTADLWAHKTLLDLSRGPDGKARIVTTNFDLLFEACDRSVFKWNFPKLPDPRRVAELDGIVHLHGHVTENYDGAAGDGFIISSAEFALMSRKHESGRPRVTVRAYYEGLPVRAGRGPDEGGESRRMKGGECFLSVPGSTVPKPKIAAVERRKACALLATSARCRMKVRRRFLRQRLSAPCPLRRLRRSGAF